MTQIANRLQTLLGDLYNPIMIGFKIIGVIILSVLVVKIGSIIIRKFFEKQKTLKLHIDIKRIDTMSTLLISVFRYGIYIMAGVTSLTYIFKESVLAAAGVGGVVIGLGAQSLIKDIISGFFIVFENQYVVGDCVTIEGMNGMVEEMELRVTKVRNFNGDLYIIPNGEIKKVTNHTRGNKAVIVDIPVAYGTDIGKVVDAAGCVCKSVQEEFNNIVETPKVLGITEFGKDSMNLRIMARAMPSDQFEIERRIRRLVIETFTREGLGFFDKTRIVLDEGLLKGEGLDGR